MYLVVIIFVLAREKIMQWLFLPTFYIFMEERLRILCKNYAD
jgi:hypothetical protein